MSEFAVQTETCRHDPAARVTRIHCPCCGDERGHRLLYEGKPGQGAIYRCPTCQLTRLLPLPDAVREADDGHGMYAEKAQELDRRYERQVDQAVDGYLRKLHRMGRLVGTVLDLGGGMGYYSRAFARRGVRVTYIDRDPVSLAFARPLNDEAGVETVAMPAEQFAADPANGGRFDLIFFRHVIEHTHHPDEVLAAIQPLCAAHGTLLVETDNNASYEHLLHPSSAWYWQNVYRSNYGLKSLWQMLRSRPVAIDKAETHYYAFRKRNLGAMLERARWDVVERFDYALGDRTYWPNIARPWRRNYWRLKRGPARWLRFAYLVALPLLALGGMRAGLCFIARPKQVVANAAMERKAA